MDNHDNEERDDRLDRLLRAQEEAGLPGIDEPPIKEGDTPTGGHTPPKGIDAEELRRALGRWDAESTAMEADDDEPPTIPMEPAYPRQPAEDDAPIKEDKPQASRQPPAFLHPTDPVPQQPQAPAEPDEDDLPFKIQPSEAGWEDSTGAQTPGPDVTDAVPPSGVRVDESGMPLPRQVPTEDPDATIAAPSAFRDPPETPIDETVPRGYKRPDLQQTQPASRVPPAPPPPPSSRAARAAELSPGPSVPPVSGPAPARAATVQGGQAVAQPARKQRRLPQITWGCVARTAALVLIGAFVALVLGGGAGAIYYSQVTAPVFRDIQQISDLQERALQFESTRIYDAQGNVLYTINDPEGGLRDYVELEEMSPWIIHATVSTEEREYFTNPGFSIPAIIRAVIQNIREGRTVSGASTITQQLTRALLLPEEERFERTYSRKIKEIFLAAELARRFEKEEILELYLNQIYYSNLAYGIEAASQLYFDKPASELNAAEAAFLAGIPQAPALYDPVSNPQIVLGRQEQALGLMLEAGTINTGNSGLVLPTFTADDYAEALRYRDTQFPDQFEAPDFAARYPHWVVYIQQQLEADETIGASIYTSGYDVYTTLDPRIQDFAQAQVQATLAGLTDRNVTNASVVVVDVETGAIRAMIGSRDFNDERIDGQVNIALSPQQPGSSIKPFTYLAAFRDGWTPATVIWDVPISYEIPGFGVYEPVNYDGTFSGPVSARFAVANSLNIPAVLALDYAGIDDLLQVLNDVGVTSLGTPEDAGNYGLSLTLGAGEVQLMEWTNAYAVLARDGQYLPTFAIERVEIDGEPVEGYPYEPPEPEQVLDPQHAFLMQDIMSDYEARVPSFGRDTPLSPPGYVAAAKTGTTNDFRDNWTMGYTTDLAVGVWVGNTDNSPMLNVTGVTGAGPIWRGVMDFAAGLPEYNPGTFEPPPPGIIVEEICADDGAVPSEFCRERSRVRPEVFDADNPPPPPEEGGLYRRVQIDTFTGLVANEFCPDHTTEELYLAIPNPSQLIDVPNFALDWLINTERGRNWVQQRNINLDEFMVGPVPEEACARDTPRPQVAISFPQNGEMLEGEIVIRGTADAPNFAYYVVDFGLSADPQGWGEVQGRTSQIVRDGALARFDLAPFGGDTITFRLRVFNDAGGSAESRVTITVAEPTPTPTPTVTPTPEETEVPEEPTATPTPDAVTPTPGNAVPTATPEEEE